MKKAFDKIHRLIGASVLLFFLVCYGTCELSKATDGSRAQAAMNACKQNLRKIQAAKEEWGLRNPTNTTAHLTMADLMSFGNPSTNHCPRSGVHSLSIIGESPSCTIHGTIDFNSLE